MSKKTKTAKCPYTDEQLSLIMSAKAGKQFVRFGYDGTEARGCLNQIAFYGRDLGSGDAVNSDKVGRAAVDCAYRFDSISDYVKLSYEVLLRTCRA